MLSVAGLCKRFDGRLVVDDVSFTAASGEVTGYLGPNGSGKSTTVKIVTGLLEPSEGSVLYRGEPISRNLIEYRRVLGYVPEEPYLYLHLTGQEYLEFVGQLRGLPEAKLATKIREFLRIFGLEGDRHSPLASYSKGMRQKILLASALLHNPEVVVLDEPFSGLDVNSSLVLRTFIQRLGEAGKVVLYSSHVLETVEKLCARVVILHKGRVVANGSVTELRALSNLPSLEQIFSQLVLEQDLERSSSALVEAMQL
jgi:ABC-2 type transport system ATP-binding protein